MNEQADKSAQDEDYEQDYELSGRREWAHALPESIAAALNLFDPPEVVDEALLAKVLRGIAFDLSALGHSLFLRALADALDHPKAEMKLTLSRGRRGRPGDKTKIERALAIGPFVARLVKRGWKKEAAVQQAMSQWRLSRAAVLRSCSEYRQLRPLVADPIQMEIDAAFHHNRRKSVKH